MQRRLTAEQLEKNIANVNFLVSLIDDERRIHVERMLDGPVGEQYFLAPASSRADYHSCYPGGLMVHSLNVVRNLNKLIKALAPEKFQNRNSSIALAGLFHDLGKVGDGKEPYYLPEESDWHRDKLGQFYRTNKACVQMPTSERGLLILQEHGVRLEPDEYLAIRLNDGMYTEENRPYAMKEPTLALLLHWADRFSVDEEKTVDLPQK